MFTLHPLQPEGPPPSLDMTDLVSLLHRSHRLAAWGDAHSPWTISPPRPGSSSCSSEGGLCSVTTLNVLSSLDQHGGMVCFTENPENLDSVLIAQRLDSQLTACMALESQLSSLDRELTLDPRYVHRVNVCVWVLL